MVNNIQHNFISFSIIHTITRYSHSECVTMEMKNASRDKSDEHEYITNMETVDDNNKKRRQSIFQQFREHRKSMSLDPEEFGEHHLKNFNWRNITVHQFQFLLSRNSLLKIIQFMLAIYLHYFGLHFCQQTRYSHFSLFFLIPPAIYKILVPILLICFVLSPKTYHAIRISNLVSIHKEFDHTN